MVMGPFGVPKGRASALLAWPRAKWTEHAGLISRALP
jgi:hypothetical protein